MCYNAICVELYDLLINFNVVGTNLNDNIVRLFTDLVNILYSKDLLLKLFKDGDDELKDSFTSEDFYDLLVNDIQDIVNTIYNQSTTMNNNTIRNILYIFYVATNDINLRTSITDRTFDIKSNFYILAFR